MRRDSRTSSSSHIAWCISPGSNGTLLRRLRLGRNRGEYSPLSGIRVRAGGRNPEPALTAAHEIGHWLDHSGMPFGRSYGLFFSRGVADGLTGSSSAVGAPEMARLLDAIRGSEATADIERLLDQDDEWRKWLLDPIEMFARSYAQWLAWKDRSAPLRAELDRALASPILRDRMERWGLRDFLPIAKAMDDLMEAVGWLRKR